MASDLTGGRNIKVLVSPSGFKESLDPQLTAECIERGVLRVVPGVTVVKLPLVDGGEGFAKALVAATGGELRYLTVQGPVGDRIESHYGLLGGHRQKTAVVEMAAAAGLRLVPKNIRDPSITSTFGVGQTILAALKEGAERVLVGCGDSGTCDGGVGMAQALGARFFDEDENEIPPASGGKALSRLARVDVAGLHPGLKQTNIDVACNWNNVLCGPKGVARVFGPQKGASPEEVEALSAAMDNVATVVSQKLGRDISQEPGSGASGGLGAGLLLIGAKLHSRFDIIMKFLEIDHDLDDCHLVFTAEGGIDNQTPRGKIPAEVAKRAKTRGLPVVALAGTIGKGASVNYDIGIDAFASITQGPSTLEGAIADAERLLTDSAESAMRLIMVGTAVQQGVAKRAAAASASTSVPVTASAVAKKKTKIPLVTTENRLTSLVMTLVIPTFLFWTIRRGIKYL